MKSNVLFSAVINGRKFHAEGTWNEVQPTLQAAAGAMAEALQPKPVPAKPRRRPKKEKTS